MSKTIERLRVAQIVSSVTRYRMICLALREPNVARIGEEQVSMGSESVAGTGASAARLAKGSRITKQLADAEPHCGAHPLIASGMLLGVPDVVGWYKPRCDANGVECGSMGG
jgi:hypothetical protein